MTRRKPESWESRMLRVERRAAELAAWMIESDIPDLDPFTDSEGLGWEKHFDNRTPVADRQLAGWLAREIWWSL